MRFQGKIVKSYRVSYGGYHVYCQGYRVSCQITGSIDRLHKDANFATRKIRMREEKSKGTKIAYVIGKIRAPF